MGSGFSRIQQAVAHQDRADARQRGPRNEVSKTRWPRVAGTSIATGCRTLHVPAEILVAASKAAVLVFGGLKALEHQLTPGDVVLFLAYLDRIYDPIQNLTGLYTSLQQNVASVRRAAQLLNVAEAPGEDLPRLRVPRGEVVFDKVRFGYDPDRPVLRDISFRIEAGERVALIGPSGAGSAITALLRDSSSGRDRFARRTGLWAVLLLLSARAFAGARRTASLSDDVGEHRYGTSRRRRQRLPKRRRARGSRRSCHGCPTACARRSASAGSSSRSASASESCSRAPSWRGLRSSSSTSRRRTSTSRPRCRSSRL